MVVDNETILKFNRKLLTFYLLFENINRRCKLMIGRLDYGVIIYNLFRKLTISLDVGKLRKI